MLKLAVALVAGSVPSLADGAVREIVSWGQPGLSRDAFDAGSRTCALKAARRDVAGDVPARRYLRGHEVLERENNMPAMPPPPGEDENFRRAQSQVLLRRMYRPDQHVDALQAKLQDEVSQCLREAGYVRFALSSAQAKKLRTFRPGSEARKAYLYSLGSDPRIVEAQRIR